MLLDKLRTLLQPQRRASPFEHAGLRPVIDETASAWPFAEAAVDVSPAVPGVFFLYARGQLIYIGVAVRGSSIREELSSHLHGVHGNCTREATAYIYEPAADALVLHRKYLEQHRARYGGRLPACNPQ